MQSWSQWPHGLRHRSADARLLKLWVRIPLGAWMSVVSVVWCQKSLRWANHSSRGVLPNVVHHCVWSRNLVNEEALAHWGVAAPKTKIYTDYNSWCSSLHVLHTTSFLLLLRWICGSTVDRSMYSSGLKNLKSKTSSYSFGADCSYCFWTIKGAVLKNELSTIVS